MYSTYKFYVDIDTRSHYFYAEDGKSIYLRNVRNTALIHTMRRRTDKINISILIADI
jgi:hypothetical protein